MTDRPTTKDLARAAGVSLATVDRVLNGRSGVRQKTVDSVNRAIREIGFERNMLAAALARRRGARFAFVLPETGDEFRDGLLARIAETERALAAEQIAIETHCLSAADPHRTAAHLASLDADTYDGVALLAPRTPQIRDALHRLAERGIHPLAFLADQGDAAPFVGTDNRAAGATAAALMGRFAAGRDGPVLVLGDSLQSRDAIDRRAGFDAVMARDFAALRPLPSLETRGDPTRTRAIIARAVAAHPDLIGVYVLTSEARPPLKALGQVAPPGLIRIAHERTSFTQGALRRGQVDAIITQDQGHLVRSAIRTLRARVENRPILAGQERIRIEILLKENL
ncbi:MAG: LacI family DNA-binding transcriptional regulator [Pseudomonadota bacterium]